MDYLIYIEEDANLLVEAEIISNYVGDSARITNMFNKLRTIIYLSPLATWHSQGFKKHAMKILGPTLKSVYFNNYWIGTVIVFYSPKILCASLSRVLI